mmetsp:Transcript_28158/g.67629  ORF Transcript_28158/g.67629 Transcript_28158/m.67629 type:complete len:529 (-) Transcript_28158:248-1834(-)
MVEIQRAHNRDTSVISRASLRIDVRNQRRSGEQHRAQRFEVVHARLVWLHDWALIRAPRRWPVLVAATIVCRSPPRRHPAVMAPHDRAPGRPLHPSQIQLLIISGANDVMGPESESDISGSHGKIRLVGQRGPHDAADVTGETVLVPVVAEATEAGKHNTTLVGALPVLLATADRVRDPHLVRPDGGVHLVQRPVLTSVPPRLPLLPINPPEIHALLLDGQQNQILQCVHICLVSQREIHGGGYFRIQPHSLAHVFEGVLPNVDAAGVVQVRSHVQTLALQPSQHDFREREQMLIPAVPSPVILPVPVHVQDKHIQGQPTGGVVFHTLADVLGGEIEPSGVPDATRVPREHGDLPANRDQIRQGLLVVQPMCEQIEIGVCLVTQHGPVFIRPPIVVVQHGPGGLIDQSPSRPADQAPLAVVLLVLGAVQGHGRGAVQGSEGAHEVAGVLVAGHAEFPGLEVLSGTFLGPGHNRRVALGKRQLSIESELQSVCLDRENMALVGDVEVGNRNIPVHKSQTWAVLELPPSR